MRLANFREFTIMIEKELRMMTNKTIRRASLADMERILEIYAIARKFMADNGNPTQWKDGYPQREMLEEDIRLERLYVVEAHDIRGVFMFTLGDDPTYTYIEGAWSSTEPYGVIHRIAVARPGQGIIAKIFDWALAQCPNLRIDTHVDNAPMRRALEKYGFQYCGIIRIFNGDERIAFHKVK